MLTAPIYREKIISMRNIAESGTQQSVPHDMEHFFNSIRFSYFLSSSPPIPDTDTVEMEIRIKCNDTSTRVAND